MPSNSPLSEKLHVFLLGSFYLLRYRASSIISTCQDKEPKNIYITKSLKYQPGLKYKVYPSYQLLLDIPGDQFCSRLLAFPFWPPGSGRCMWGAQKGTTLGRMVNFTLRHEQPHSHETEKHTASTVTTMSSQGDAQHFPECVTGSKKVSSEG